MSLSDSYKAQKDLAEHRKAAEARKPANLKRIMQLREGREFIYDLLAERCCLFGASFTGDSKTFLREGMRKVAIDLTKDLEEHCINEYVLMISEAYNVKRHDALVEQAAIATAAREDQE